MVTIQDIAEKLNVSKGTVSKALNGATDVSETLRKSILETAVEMGYSRTLHKRDAKTLCIFIENMSCQEPNDFGYDIVVGFRKAAEPSGYLVEVVPLDDKTQKHTRYDEYMLKHNYAGALFLGLSLSDVWLHDLQTAHTPAVLLDNYINGGEFIDFLIPGTLENFRLTLTEFEDADTAEITPRVSAGQHKKIRIRPQVWNKPIAEIKKLLPQYTIARKPAPLSGDNQKMYEHKLHEFDVLCQNKKP